IHLLKTQYTHFVNFDLTNKENKTASQLAEENNNEFIKEEIEKTTIPVAVIANDYKNYEINKNWKKLSESRNSCAVINEIEKQIISNNVSVAMTMLFGYLKDKMQDQGALLAKIHENIYIFLRYDAVTPRHKSILHLLSMFAEPYSYSAARLMETLFANFKYFRDNINNIKDNFGFTALHTAAKYNNKYAASVLKKWEANHELENYKRPPSTALQYALRHEQTKSEEESELAKVVDGTKKINIEPIYKSRACHFRCNLSIN
ncbi:MAG: hypothetical protein ACK4PR_07060, partial [Gammaproteobacteria bacterium]